MLPQKWNDPIQTKVLVSLFSIGSCFFLASKLFWCFHRSWRLFSPPRAPKCIAVIFVSYTCDHPRMKDNNVMVFFRPSCFLYPPRIHMLIQWLEPVFFSLFKDSQEFMIIDYRDHVRILLLFLGSVTLWRFFLGLELSCQRGHDRTDRRTSCHWIL